MKRFISLITTIIMIVSLCYIPASAADYESAVAEAENVEINYNRSMTLKADGNKLVEADTGKQVVLRGVNIPSLGWGMAEHIYESMTMVYDNWHSNIIRLPIQPKYWFDNLTEAERKPGVISGDVYQKYIDDVVKAAQARGKYVIIDCHTYVMPLQESLDMWEVVAAKYANNSAVLFGLLNEPHDIKPVGIEKPTTADQWEVWYNGGQITINGKEVTAIGHQPLLEAIRATGANNICIAGGLNWAFDISGFADGYDGRPNGYRLEDTASGNGVMYDSHAYPVKGAKSSWDKTIGPVRKVAPVLIGEWGWDSSDNAISGGDSTSDIWMGQIANWMDDVDGEYGGVPVNWTGWNMHMSSSPRMLYSWDFKTTAYNGTHIKKRLQSYDTEPEKLSGVYQTDFSEDRVFRSYTGQNGKATVKYSSDDENVVITHQTGEWSSKLDFPYDWDLNGIQTITMDISSDVSETIDIGLYGADMEVWTTPIKIDSITKTVTISIDQLVKQGNPMTDGILDAALSGIYFGSNAETEGNITVDNVKIVKLADPVYTAKAYPHQDTGAESYYDIDVKDFPSEDIVAKGDGADSYFTSENVTVDDAQGNSTIAKHISYNRINGSYGGNAQYNLEIPPSMNTKYFTITIKGSGSAQVININLGSKGNFDVSLMEGDTEWYQYIFSTDGYIEYPEEVNFIRITASKKLENEFWIDNVGFCNVKPERTAYGSEKTFVYDFATYNRNTGKYEAEISTLDGGDGDSITAEKVDGGYDTKTQALGISYTIGGSDRRAKALVKYSSSDFFKGNANDDPRTADRGTLKDRMVYMEDLVVYGKSTSGKNEKVNIGVIDATDSINTYTTERTITLTPEGGWIRIPFDWFTVIDSGNPMDCARVRGFVFSSASTSGEGSFIIDNITHTNMQEWPKETPPPTEKKITTNEELLALTSEDGLITLGADIDLDSDYFAAKWGIVIDLNGHALTSSAAQTIEVLDDFTIMDSSEDKTGVITNTNAGATSYVLKIGSNRLTINVEGVKVESQNGQAIYVNSDSASVKITDSEITGGAYGLYLYNGNITIKDTVVEKTGAATGSAVLAGAGDNYSANVTVTGSTLRVSAESGSSRHTFNVSGSNTTVTIDDSTLTNPNSKSNIISTDKFFAGTITINSGTFENTDETNPGSGIYDGNEGPRNNKLPEIIINGGIFGSAINQGNKSQATIIVRGGTYPFDPTDYLDTEIAELEVIDNEDGTYTVTGYVPPKPDDPEDPDDPDDPDDPSEPPEQYIYDITHFDKNTITVEVTKPAEEKMSDSDTMYVAAYTDGILRGIYILKCDEIEAINNFDTPLGAKDVKVFIWNEDMKPIGEELQY